LRVRRVVGGLILGLILGSVVASAGNAAAIRAVGLLEPIGQLWVNAIRMTVVPLVVSLLFVSVARDADRWLGRMGVVTIAVFVVILLFSAVLALLLAPSLMRDMKLTAAAAESLRASATSNGQHAAALHMALPGFAAWLTSLVPVNAVGAAAEGAMLPLIVFTLLAALAARTIDTHLRQPLIDVFAAIAAIMTRLVEWIIAVAPIGIFALIAPAASRAGVTLAGAVVYYVVAISAVLLLFALLLYPVASIGGRIPLPRFLRAVLPAQAVALSSSSSLASLPALVEGGMALELPAPVTGFVLPLSVSAFKAAAPITWMVGTLFLARLYGVTLGGGALVMIALTGAALSLTIPGVPQGAQLMLAPMLVTYGIPPEGIALLIAADTIPDLMGTMANVTADLAVSAVVGALVPADDTPAVVADSWSESASSADG
jgi:proton glutamate symport protein